MSRFNSKYIEEARCCIDAKGLIGALESHAMGETKMTATQVSAALALLKKVMPDLSTASSKKTEEEKEISHEEALQELD